MLRDRQFMVLNLLKGQRTGNFDRPPKRLSHQFGQSFLFLLHLICYRRSRRIQ